MNRHETIEAAIRRALGDMGVQTDDEQRRGAQQIGLQRAETVATHGDHSSSPLAKVPRILCAAAAGSDCPE